MIDDLLAMGVQTNFFCSSSWKAIRTKLMEAIFFFAHFHFYQPFTDILREVKSKSVHIWPCYKFLKT
jgi:hypothetical protein